MEVDTKLPSSFNEWCREIIIEGILQDIQKKGTSVLLLLFVNSFSSGRFNIGFVNIKFER